MSDMKISELPLATEVGDADEIIINVDGTPVVTSRATLATLGAAISAPGGGIIAVESYDLDYSANATGNTAKIQQALTDASGGGKNTRIVSLPSRTIYIDAPIVIPPGITLAGRGTGLGDNSGTYLQASTSFTGAAMISFAAAGGWHHGTRLQGFRLHGQDLVDYGIHQNEGSGELYLLDDVAIGACLKSGVYWDGKGTPMTVGRLSVNNCGEYGFHVFEWSSALEIQNISGDNNALALVHLDSPVDGSAVVTIDSLKAERNLTARQDTILLITNPAGVGVNVGMIHAHSSKAASVAPAATAVVREVGTGPAVNLNIASIRTNALYQHPTAFASAITGAQVGMGEASRTGIRTTPTIVLPGDFGGAQVERYLSAAVGTTETRIPHHMRTTPVVLSIVPEGAAVQVSRPADSRFVYLTATTATTCRVAIGRGATYAAWDTTTLFDTFTAADGTALSAHTPDVGTWTFASGGMDIHNNRLIPIGGNRLADTEVGAADMYASAIVSMGADGGGREGGLIFRMVNGTNYWKATLLRNLDGTFAEVRVSRLVAGVLTTVVTTELTGLLEASSDHLLVVSAIGGEARVYFDSALLLMVDVSGFHATGTKAGVRVDTNPGVIEFDDAHVAQRS